MKSIYLVFTATGTLVSRCIGLYTKARYNHVSLCLDSEIREFYSFGRKILWFPLVGGFVVEHIDSGVYKAYGETTCAIYRLDISDDKYELLKKRVNLFIKNSKLYGYNLLGLIGVMLNMPLKRKTKYFCTQFVATMLSRCNIHDFGKDPSLVTPWDFYEIEGLKPVYEGRLSDIGRIAAAKTAAV
jgi:hypothetical protein